jgi:CheY-like chemotaxis protein
LNHLGCSLSITGFLELDRMPKTILIVDDNLDEVEILVLFLRRKGLSNPIQVLPDGLAAIDYLYGLEPYSNRQIHPFPALIFLDIQMPRATGVDLLQWLQAHPEIPTPKLVIWTNTVDSGKLKECAELGATSFLFIIKLDDQFRELLRSYPDIWEFADPSPSRP